MSDTNELEYQDSLERDIEDVDLDVVADFNLGLERKSPCGDQETQGVLMRLWNVLPSGVRAADMGCGSGHVSSLLLGLRPDMTITGVDTIRREVEAYNTLMEKYGLSSRGRAVMAPLEDPPFESESLDLVWAEGSVQNVGFEEALTCWRRFLRPGGVTVVTDPVWLDETERPVDTEWVETSMPDICTLEEKKRWMASLGYEVLEAFPIETGSVIENYYSPIFKMLPSFLEAHSQSRTAQMIYQSMRYEIAYFNRYSYLWGQAVLVGRKV